jgi:hypothetical protein
MREKYGSLIKRVYTDDVWEQSDDDKFGPRREEVECCRKYQ